MAEKASTQKATASSLTMLKAFVHDYLEKLGLGPSTTLIRNESDVTIFLIPISCTRNTDPVSRGKINEDLAMRIESKKIELVNCSLYDCGRMDADSQIHILFLAGSKNTDSLKNFLKNFSLKDYKGRKPYPHNFLYHKRDLSLTLENKKVIVDETAGQDEEKKKKEQLEQKPESLVTAMVSPLENLLEDVAKLKGDVAKLIEDVEKLQTGKIQEKKQQSPSNTSRTC